MCEAWLHLSRSQIMHIDVLMISGRSASSPDKFKLTHKKSGRFSIHNLGVVYKLAGGFGRELFKKGVDLGLDEAEEGLLGRGKRRMKGGFMLRLQAVDEDEVG